MELEKKLFGQEFNDILKSLQLMSGNNKPLFCFYYGTWDELPIILGFGLVVM